jgi:hypothetical protein
VREWGLTPAQVRGRFQKVWFLIAIFSCKYVHTYKLRYGWTDRQMGGKMDWQADIQMVRWTDRQNRENIGLFNPIFLATNLACNKISQ